jgi:hypothetical protein
MRIANDGRLVAINNAPHIQPYSKLATHHCHPMVYPLTVKRQIQDDKSLKDKKSSNRDPRKAEHKHFNQLNINQSFFNFYYYFFFPLFILSKSSHFFKVTW